MTNNNPELATSKTILALLSERAKLRATVERMRGALEKIANSATAGIGCNPEGMVKIARAALTTGEEK